ncbi:MULTISPECIES: hypothetical protein [unclassified Pseudomonas]|uniref:hypothetical protein n=1 Tax=unclassified Pseudomonas TaxID=196821 RepID=UPI00128D6840|nr:MULTISPECIES: hypothetical protein [unclassified Pseudomonas]MPQ69530.1 hypothetical protein [Pseudomonas sp. MWU12-2323]
MSILNNSVASIQIGMEDFKSNDPRRVLSVIRNIYAGILLLFKHKLQEMSPVDSDEVLLKIKVIPSVNKTTGEIAWVGKGTKTVEVVDIQERLTALGIKGVDWKRLRALQRIRNDIEHYFTRLPEDKMREAVSNALHLIVEFCEPHLEVLPQDLFGLGCWNFMLAEATVYDAELAACQQNLKSVAWPYNVVAQSVPEMVCPECDSHLIRVFDIGASADALTFRCSACDCESSYSEIVAPAVELAMAAENYWSIKDGGDPVTSECPACGKETYIYHEAVCVVCSEGPENTECTLCGAPLTVDECFHGDVCSYCQYKYDKLRGE